MPVSNCARCGAKIKGKPMRVLKSSNTPTEQVASVQFRRRVNVSLSSEVTTFHPSQIISLAFSIIETVLLDQIDSVNFLSQIDKAEFLIMFPKFKGKI